jgi:hypothetical protein
MSSGHIGGCWVNVAGAAHVCELGTKGCIRKHPSYVEPSPETPRMCPDCGEENAEARDYRNYRTVETGLHTDPKQCIQYLKDELRRCVRALEGHNLL